MLRRAVGPDTSARFTTILAGDIVARKKPAPDIYRLAAERLGVAPTDSVVIEDSANGLRAAATAGMPCVVTVSDYTRDEDFLAAGLVLTCLGDPGGEECLVLANRSAAQPGTWLTVDDLERIVGG